jgi:hypothetical protein
MTGPSLCIFNAIGIKACPGCGIAHAMQSAMHLNFAESFHHHVLGIPAVLVLCYRVYVLTFSKIKLNAEPKLHDPDSIR